MPRAMGPMSLRPGTKYLFSSLSNNTAKYLKFIFALDDTALIEVTDSNLRFITSDTVLTRAAVTAAVTNGTFDSNITSWTTSGTVAWVTGGYAGITGAGSSTPATMTQQVTVNEASTRHALRIVVQRGPVLLRVGSTSGGDEYISETKLGTGTHSIAFTPTGNFHVQFRSYVKRQVLVDSCTVESSGAVTITAPWAAADLANLRYDQSGDILYVACKNYQPRKIERRSDGTTKDSWSIVLYEPEDGPFRGINTGVITMTAGALTGNTTLTASAPYFKSTNVGSLFFLTNYGQTQTKAISAEANFTDAIKISATGAARRIKITLTGTWAGTVTLQRSFTSENGPWNDVPSKTWTSNTNQYDPGQLADASDTTYSAIEWYRIGVKTGDYTSGTVTATIFTEGGTSDGVCRVTAYTSTTQVSVEVLEDIGDTGATNDWREGKWSSRRGFPTAVAFHEGRLWWFGKDQIIGSVSDSFESFDPNYEGDAGPVLRTIGSGPVDTINWGLSLQRLVVGGQTAEYTVRSSSLDEPLTPTNNAVRVASGQGSAAVPAAKLDRNGIYVQRAKYRIYEVALDDSGYDYTSNDLTMLVPEMASPGIVRMDIQRQPDTRIHCVRSDGTVMIGVIDRTEQVLAWVDFDTSGATGVVEDVVIMPGTSQEDDVYYLVKRTVNGATKRYLEKWATEATCRGGTYNYLADSYVLYDSTSTTSITGLGHLEGEEVVVWADGADVGTTAAYGQTYTVSSGAITLTTAASTVIVGLPYTATWKSAKLVSGDAILEALSQKTRINRVSLLMAWAHPKGLRFGPDTTNLDDLPLVEAGTTINSNTIRTDYAEESVMFPGGWLLDARLVLKAQAPRPVTVLAAVPDTRSGNQ